MECGQRDQALDKRWHRTTAGTEMEMEMELPIVIAGAYSCDCSHARPEAGQ